MIAIELQFECFDNTTVTAVDQAINRLIEAWRYNGQILGREFPIIMGDGDFRVRVVCPEEDSLQASYNSDFVNLSIKRLSEAMLLSPKAKLLGRDINSEESADDQAPSWQVIYTTYLHTCSPLRSGDTLMPIPLYRNPATFNGDHKSVIKWQTEWQACDEVQMADACAAKFAAVREMSDVSSDLFRRGWDIRGRIEHLTKIPTYYYQYQVGGTSLKEQQDRHCPKCGNAWRVETTLHDIFDFKCDECRIVSNLSWDFQ